MAAARGRRHPRPLRRDRGARGRVADRRGGRDRHADRLQRRRQVDDAALDLRPHPGERPAGSRSTARTSPRLPAHEIVGRGIALVPRGPPLLPAHDRAREPRPRRPSPPRDADIGEDLERVFELFPRLKERERQKAGTMSGGEQQMLAIGRALMARPQAADARRAFDGDRADPRAADLRDDRARSTAGRGDPAGRAERQLRARRLEARLRAGDGARGARERSSELRDDPEVQRAYLGT